MWGNLQRPLLNCSNEESYERKKISPYCRISPGISAWLHNSCKIGKGDLPDMYAQSPRAAGLRVSGGSQMPMVQLIPSGELKAAQARNL